MISRKNSSRVGLDTYHSHLVCPGPMLAACLAGRPHAMTEPCSSYRRHVGTLRKVSDEPGQFKICCTWPEAIREDPYACHIQT